ncbi:MAG: type II secretion system F family protein [Candidatus Diapherotrites archaeon]|nr:type II secretion system F family protein [Candidatus Diapherotrites archaeon]
MNEMLAGGAVLLGAIGVMGWMGPGAWKKISEQRNAARLEAQLPFFLLALSYELQAQTPFEQALRNAHRHSGKNLRQELETVLTEIHHKGTPPTQALQGWAARIPSRALKRSMAQLANLYRHGTKTRNATPLRRMAQELLFLQQNQCREFGQKMALYALMFIAVSAILPALFQSFVTIGSAFMELDFTPAHMLFMAAIGFPLLDILMMAFMRFSMPPALEEE